MATRDASWAGDSVVGQLTKTGIFNLVLARSCKLSDLRSARNADRLRAQYASVPRPHDRAHGGRTGAEKGRAWSGGWRRSRSRCSDPGVPRQSRTIRLPVHVTEGVLHYRELWQNYRTTEQYLDSQI